MRCEPQELTPTLQVRAEIDARFKRVCEGPLSTKAPTGIPFDTISAKDGDKYYETADRAMAELGVLLTAWVERRLGDTIYWRLAPTAYLVADSTNGGYYAMCRVMTGFKSNEFYEPAEHADGVNFAVVKDETGAEPSAAEPPAQIEPDDKWWEALPTWRSHKVVRAAKIIRYTERRDGTGGIWHLTGPTCVVLTKDLIKRVPADVFVASFGVGGYFVRYEDGYQSWSPADAFEQGYRQIDLDREARNPVGAGVLALEELALAFYAQNWPKGEKWDRLREICRRLAHSKGFDPDRAVVSPIYGVSPHGPNGCFALTDPIIPLWAAYLPEVAPIIDLVDRADANPGHGFTA